MAHDWHEGLQQVPLHLATWGVVGGIIAARHRTVLLVSILCFVIGFEISDVIGGTDTWGAALIDVFAKVTPAVVVWWILHTRKKRRSCA